MSSDLFKQHGAVIHSLINESVSCTPKSWESGTINIKRDGESISSHITNSEGNCIERPGNKFADLCEKIFYHMANMGSEWKNAEISYKYSSSFYVETLFVYEAKGDKNCFTIIPLPQSDSELSLIVKSYIKDYEAWNSFAFERSSISKNTVEDPTYQSYKEIIQKYCLKDKKFQGLAYGGDSAHSLLNEKVISAIQSDECGIVTTLTTQGTEHEYHFFIAAERWILDEVYYIDTYSGRKYECL